MKITAFFDASNYEIGCEDEWDGKISYIKKDDVVIPSVAYIFDEVCAEVFSRDHQTSGLLGTAPATSLNAFLALKALGAKVKTDADFKNIPFAKGVVY